MAERLVTEAGDDLSEETRVILAAGDDITGAQFIQLARTLVGVLRKQAAEGSATVQALEIQIGDILQLIAAARDEGE